MTDSSGDPLRYCLRPAHQPRIDNDNQRQPDCRRWRSGTAPIRQTQTRTHKIRLIETQRQRLAEDSRVATVNSATQRRSQNTSGRSAKGQLNTLRHLIILYLVATTALMAVATTERPASAARLQRRTGRTSVIPCSCPKGLFRRQWPVIHFCTEPANARNADGRRPTLVGLGPAIRARQSNSRSSPSSHSARTRIRDISPAGSPTLPTPSERRRYP